MTTGWDTDGVTVGRARDDGGLLILRVWREDDADEALRVRITRADDVTQPETEVTVTPSVEEAVAVTRRWLERFERGGVPKNPL